MAASPRRWLPGECCRAYVGDKLPTGTITFSWRDAYIISTENSVVHTVSPTVPVLLLWFCFCLVVVLFHRMELTLAAHALPA